MPALRPKGKASASKVRDVSIRAGEDKPLPAIYSTQVQDQKRDFRSADHIHRPKLAADDLERVATRSELQSQTTKSQTGEYRSKLTSSVEGNAKPQCKHETREIVDERKPLSNSAITITIASRNNYGTDHVSDSPTEDDRKPLKQLQSEKDPIDLASEEDPVELRRRIMSLQARIRQKDTEHARYLDAINENRETMQMQSDRLHDREAQIQELQRKAQANQKRHLQSSSQAREQEIRSQKQEHTIRSLQSRLDKMAKDLSASEQHTSQLERAWKGATEEITKLRQQSSVQKVDDSTLKAAYEEIIYSVSNWAGNYSGGQDASFQKSDLVPLQSLTPHYLQYMTSEILRPVLIQSFVMKLLVDNILSYSDSDPNGLLWAGCLSPGLRLIQKALEFGDGFTTQELLLTGKIRQSQVQEYGAWKAKSAILIAEKATEDDVGLLVDDMQNHFQNMLSPFLTRNKPETWTDLREIIQMAVRLDKEVHMSRALFTFGKWGGPEGDDYGFEFDEETSVSAHGFEPARKGMNAELVVAPFLMKTGTGDGDAYQDSFYLLKCVVVCTESRRMLEDF